jgi:hypothetical protein
LRRRVPGKTLLLARFRTVRHRAHWFGPDVGDGALPWVTVAISTSIHAGM